MFEYFYKQQLMVAEHYSFRKVINLLELVMWVLIVESTVAAAIYEVSHEIGHFFHMENYIIETTIWNIWK